MTYSKYLPHIDIMDLYSYLMSLHLNRHLLAFIFIPVIQKEMDIFRETVWNSHRVRSQKDIKMPKGKPYHLYSCPEQYNAIKCGMGIFLNIYCTTKHVSRSVTTAVFSVPLLSQHVAPSTRP